MNWYDPIIEAFIEDMDSIGLNIDTSSVQFSGFWSQGDGASFEFDARDCDNEKFIKFLIQHQDLKLTNVVVPDGSLSPESVETLCELTGEISIGRFLKEYVESFLIASERGQSIYVHHHTCAIHVDFDWADDDDTGAKHFDKWCDEITKVAEEWRISECHLLYRRLEKWYKESGQANIDSEDE
jgi:hypothetical protein